MMIVKIFKAVWFLSLLGTMAIFMYNYASLPEEIVFSDSSTFSVSRNGLFYTTVALLAIMNALVFVVTRLYPKSQEFLKAWFYGLVAFLNLFVIVALQFVSVFNSQERFDYDRIGYIIYGSIILVIIWTFIWPIYLIIQRFSNKQTV